MTDRPYPSVADVVVLAVLVCLLVPGPVVALPARQTSPAGTHTVTATQSGAVMTNVTYSGTGTFRHNGSRMLWQSSPLTVTVEFGNADNGIGLYEVCADIEATGSETCRTVSIDGDSGQARLQLPAPTAAQPGDHRLALNISNAVIGLNEPMDTKHESVTIVRKQADLDLDRLSNIREHRLGLNMTNPDIDDDGLVDGDEVDRYRTDPRQADTDDDGALDGVEVSGPTNATNPDTDGDGLLDGTELDANLDPTNPDTDGDGLSDGTEYDGITDPRSPDTDGDGLDDRAEVNGPTFPTIADSDNDGVLDGKERSMGLNATNPDTDGDFLRDGLELTIGTNPASASETVLKGIGVGIMLGILGAALVTRLRTILGTPPGETSTPTAREHGSETPVAGNGGSASDSSPDTPSTSDGTGTVPSGPKDPEITDTVSEPDPDPELLPPDERVQHMLENEDGRMRQADIVENTDWSKAKVSRTLSQMEDEGIITRYRLGRENVVTFADVDPDDGFDPNLPSN